MNTTMAYPQQQYYVEEEDYCMANTYYDPLQMNIPLFTPQELYAFEPVQQTISELDYASYWAPPPQQQQEMYQQQAPVYTEDYSFYPEPALEYPTTYEQDFYHQQTISTTAENSPSFFFDNPITPSGSPYYQSEPPALEDDDVLPNQGNTELRGMGLYDDTPSPSPMLIGKGLVLERSFGLPEEMMMKDETSGKIIKGKLRIFDDEEEVEEIEEYPTYGM